MRPSGGQGNAAAGGLKDSHPASDPRSVPGWAGKPDHHGQFRDGQEASPRTRATATTTRGAFGQRAVSAHGRADNSVPAGGSGGTQRAPNSALPSGLERVLQEFKQATGSHAPAPGRPSPSETGRRAFSDTTHQGVAAAAGGGPSEDELSKIREIIEEAVEQQVAAALAPLRVVVNELNKAIQAANDEHQDLREQNDTLSRQIDLHYRDIQQHSEIASTHIRALTNMVGAHTQINRAANENLAVTCNLVVHLSQVIANLPRSLSQIVENVVSQAIQNALGQVAAAEQEALNKVQSFLSDQFAKLESRQDSAAQQQQQQQPQQGPGHSQGGLETQQNKGGSPRGFGKIKALLSKRQ